MSQSLGTGQPPASRPEVTLTPATSMAAAPAALAASPPPPPATIPRREPADENRVAAVLNEYARAYGALDAGAAREVWPTVNERALAASSPAAQTSSSTTAHRRGGTIANASCRARKYVGKAVHRPRTEERTSFELRRDGEAWKIETAEARRQ